MKSASLKVAILSFLLTLSFGNITIAKEWWTVKIRDITISAEVVRTDKDQQLGLGNRFFLPENKGMLFFYHKPGTRVFWMKNMHFPIDILWIQNGKIVKISPNVPPPPQNTPDSRLKQYGFGVSADKVLELQAGFTQKHHLQTGDLLQFSPNN